MTTQITINSDHDGALAKVLAKALEDTYGILAKGEAAKFATALDQHQQMGVEQAKAPAGVELSPVHSAALAIGDSMKGMVKADAPAVTEAPSRVAHVAEIAAPDPGKGRTA